MCTSASSPCPGPAGCVLKESAYIMYIVYAALGITRARRAAAPVGDGCFGRSGRAGRPDRAGERGWQAVLVVPPNGLKPNLQQRLERLETVWNRAKLGVYETEAEQQKQQDFDVVTQPSRPPRTPPTPEEVDAIRTARASGESVRSIAERFNKHRSTVWRYTKELR